MNRSLRPLALTALLSILALVARPAISALQGPAAQDSVRPSVSERI